jgi:hypothetical protein
MLLSCGVAQHRRLRSSSKERSRKRLPEVWFRMLLKRTSALHSFLAEKQSGRGNGRARIGWTLNSRLSNGQGLAGLLLGTCSTRRQRCRKESAGPSRLPLIGLADATTLREPLQALAESWPLRPR